MNAPQTERQLVPGVAVIGRMPHLAIGETRVHMTRSTGIGEQRIRHGVEGLWQSTRQRLTSCAPHRADDSCLRVVLAVSFHRTGSDRGIPHFRMGRVSGNRPPIVPVKTLLRLCPGGTRIPADGDACAGATAFIDPVATRGVEGERMAIA